MLGPEFIAAFPSSSALRGYRLKFSRFRLVLPLLILVVLGEVGAGARPDGGASVTTQVQIDFIKENRAPVSYELRNGVLFFRVTIAEREAWAIFDSGSDESIIDANFANEAGLPPGEPNGALRTPTGMVPKRLIKDVPVVIPGQLRFRAPLAIANISAYYVHVGRRIDLVLGKEYISSLELIVSTQSKAFLLARSGTLAPPSEYPAIALQQCGRYAGVQIVIPPNHACVSIDMGFNGELALEPSIWGRLVPEDIKRTSEVVVNGEGAPSASKAGLLPEVRIGTVVTRDVRTSILGAPGMGDGRLGMGFLTSFDFVLDIGAGKLWLAPVGSFHLPG